MLSFSVVPLSDRVTNFARAFRRTIAAVVLCGAGAGSLAPSANAALVDAIEFYHAGFDHYFVTAHPDEIAKLDAGVGVFAGWQRTTQGLKVFDAATTGTTALAVCRFYGLPAAGLDSHFYSASSIECEDVALRFPGIWMLESSNVFRVFLQSPSGACPAGTSPIYRSWNNRADSNHRYTTDLATQQAMIARGYVAEGYGAVDPVAMCAPTSDPTTRPACVLAASNGTPVVGTQITLSVTCTNNPTAFTWTGCASVTSACTASAAGAGAATYSVVASNAGGSSVPATIQVNWIAPPPPEPAPVCSLFVTTNSETPAVGSLAMLTSSCSGMPTRYSYAGGCISGTNICLVRGNTAGGANYTVTASNSSGSGSASASVVWTNTPGPPSGLCGSYPSSLHTDMGASNGTVHSLFYADPPGFAWNGVWAVRFTVPAAAGAGQFGSLAAAEFGAPPTFREVTVSRTACDFRPNDLTGNAGPLGRAVGNSATLAFRIGSSTAGTPGLAAGQTYYFNIRNWLPNPGVISCAESQQRCDALATIMLPR